MTPPVDTSASSGTAVLAWAVKESFWRYVIDAGGSVTAVGAAEIVGAEVRFPRVVDAPPGRSAFQGGVLFDAHHGALRAAVFDPALDDGPAGMMLTARIGAREVERVALADVDRRTLAATLRIDGAVLFDFRYAPGTELAPLRFV